ncbi:Trithorax group protein osa [Halotydeus destructor]|nr:Trithorax group protein osa [Halotydeus destructor]
MADEAERKPFLDNLTAFNEERGTTISSVPTISKQSLDLFKLYTSVRDRGGYKEVTRAKLWKECAQCCGITISSSAAYTLKKQYIKLLLPYECKFDRNGISPEAMMAETESVSRKNAKNKASVAPSPGPSDSNSQGSYPQSGTPGSVDHGSSSNSYPPPHPSPSGSPYPGPGYTPTHSSPSASPYPAGPGYPPQPPTSFAGAHGHPGYPPHHGGHPHWSEHGPPPGSSPHQYGPGSGPHQPNYHGNQMYPPNPGAPSGPPNSRPVPAAPSKPYPPIGPAGQSPSPSPTSQNEANNIPSYQSSPYPNAQQIKRHPTDYMREPQAHPNNYPHGHPGNQYHHPNNTPTRPGPTPQGHHPQWNHHNQWNGDSRGYPANYPSSNGSSAAGYPNYKPGTRESWDSSAKPDANSWNMNRYGHQANSNQSYGPQSGTPSSQSHTAAPSAAPQQPPPSAPGQQGPNMNSSMPSNPPMGNYGSQTSNQQQHAAPSPDANSWNMNRYGHQANSNQSYGPQSGTPGSQSHTAAPSAAPQQPPPSAPGQQGPSMNSSMPSNPPMGSYGSQTGNQQHAAPSPGPQSQQRPGSNQGPASAPLPYPNGVPNNTTQRTFSPLQRLLTKPIQSTQQPNYPGNQMYPPVAGPQIVPPSRQAPPVATSKPSPYPPAPVAQAPSPSPAGPADHSAMPGGYPSSPYSNPQPPVKRHPDFSKEPQPYSNNYPHGHHGAPPSGQYGGYPGTLTRPGPPAVTQAPPHHSQWNGDSRNYSSGYPAATNGANAPGYPPNFRPGTREGWNQSPKPDASSWGAYRHGQPVGPAGSQSSGPQAGRPSDYPNAGPLHQMGRMNSQFSPRPPADQNARQMYPPTNAGSQLPPNKMPPPSMHGPPREIQTNQAGFPGPHHGQQIPPHLSHSSFQPIAKELNFPPNIVEGVLPKLVKRRRMTSKDLSHVDTGRLLMCLKSGMLAESTWALDVLSVLIFDDNTLMYYGLQKKLPGLLDVLLEHYTKYLAEIFEGIFNLDTQGEDISNGEDNTSVSCMRKRRRPRANKKWYELDKDFSGSSVPLSCPSSMDLEVEKAVDSCSLNIPKKDEQLLLLNSNLNFTLRSRDGKPVKIENKSEGCNPLEEEKRWETLFESNSSDSGFHDDDDDASHIQTQFESKEKFVRFARILKEKNTNMTSASVHVANQVSQKQPEINSSPVNKKPIPEQAEKMDCTDSKPLEYPCFRTPKRKHVSDCDLEDESLRKMIFHSVRLTSTVIR